MAKDDDSRDEPAEVDESDVDPAVAFWRKYAPEEFRGLIVAEPEDGQGGDR